MANQGEKQLYPYLFVLREEDVLPVHVVPARFVRQVTHISQFLFFKLPHEVRIQLGEQFLVFYQRCFTATTISSLFQAEKEYL